MTAYAPPHSIDQLRATVGQTDAGKVWLRHLDEIGPPGFEITLPPMDFATSTFLDLGVPHDEFDTLLRFYPNPEHTPGVWWLLLRAAHSVIRTIGQIQAPPAFPELPRELGAFRHYFYFYVLLAARPHTLRFHRQIGISDDISRRTLADIGRKFAVHRKNHRSGGIDTPSWLTHHIRGQLYHLGRLQFERTHPSEKLLASMQAAGLRITADDLILSVHITDFSGPISPTACDDSFQQAKSFFATHFPETPVTFAYCSSWMLDPQLACYLPASSNILQFQQRFTPAYIPDPQNRSILQFVFGCLTAEIDDLPQSTSLERAVVSHLKAGETWRGGIGWLML